MSRGCNLRRGIFLCLAAGLIAPSSSPAVEPAKQFLDALRQQKYYQVALEYLDTVQDNPAVPVQFKETLKYQRGVTLVEGARFQRDPAIKDKWLDEGQQVLTEFLSTQQGTPLAVAARGQLGNVLMERANSRMLRSQKQTGGSKDQLVTEARQLYGEAIKAYQAQVDETRERLKQYPTVIPEGERLFEEREQFRQEFLQAKVLSVAVREELAGTYPKGSPEFDKLINECLEGYQAIRSDYRLKIAGMFAQAYEARCLQKLGRHKDAIGHFTELLAQPESNDLRELRVLTMSLAIDSWMAEKLYGQLVEKAFPLVDKPRPTEDRTEEFMEMRVKIAAGFKAYADQLKAEKPRDPLIRQLLTNGRALVSYVSRIKGPSQDAARRLLADFAGADVESIAGDKPDPKTFVEARDAGRQAVQTMGDNERLIQQLNLRLPTITDAAQKAELTAEIEKAQKLVDESRSQAGQYLQRALDFVDAETSPEDLNFVRYLLCYLAHIEQRHYESVVLGEFVALRYPESQGARQCAKIAMASWLKLYVQSPGGENDFESRRIIEIADYIVQKWPGQPEAAEALNTLIEFMIREKRVKEAEEYLKKIPADSPHRGMAELKTGQAVWGSYLAGARELREWELDATKVPAGVDPSARKADLEKLKESALTTLQDGVNRMRASGEMTNIGATAVLSLAQVLVDTNQADKSIALLEDSQIGSLTLLKQNHPSTQKEGFDVETYKTALRAYISSLGSSSTPQPLIDKAKQMMDSLKAAMGEGEQNKLVGIYLNLARDLQTQMELADDSVKKGLATGFEVFLKEVDAEAKDTKILLWVADTYRAMGESFLSSGRTGREAARPYLNSAIAAYQKILTSVASDAASAALTTQIHLQMARTYRSLYRFKDAIDQYVKILGPAKGRFLLPVQIEAAQTYQEWGAFGPDHKDRYGDAILGARLDEKNPDKLKQRDRIVWGWAEVANKTQGKEQFAEQFHQARYNLALCRYKWAVAEKDAAAKAKRLAQAKADVGLTVRLFKDLGGAQQEALYDQLYRQIQKSLGEAESGIGPLKRTQPPAVQAAPAARPIITKTSTK